jgi:hypothetical protein
MISSWGWAVVLRLEYSPPWSGVNCNKIAVELRCQSGIYFVKSKEEDLRALMSKCSSSLKYTPSHSPPQTYMFIPCKMAECPVLPRGSRPSMRMLDHCLVPLSVTCKLSNSLDLLTIMLHCIDSPRFRMYRFSSAVSSAFLGSPPYTNLIEKGMYF